MSKRKLGARGVRVIGSALAMAVRALTLPFGREMGTRIAGHASGLIAPVVAVKTPRGALRFWCPSSTSSKYAVRFMRYEPDTRAWIENYVRPGQHLWDVGANIGAYALYGGLMPGVSVTAFEPMAVNFAALVKNLDLNRQAQAVALCLALSDVTQLAPFYLRDTDAGSAMHALGMPETFEGSFDPISKQTVMSVRGDQLPRLFGIRPPDHVKLDVDGHELRVLQGMAGLLPSVRTLWIEMEAAADASGENARIKAALASHGFVLRGAGRNRLFVNRKLADSAETAQMAEATLAAFA
jgi:FkbM family methyltransferase